MLHAGHTRKIGAAAVLFFLLKGLAWLVLSYGLIDGCRAL